MKSFYANKVCSTDKVPTAARLAPEEFFSLSSTQEFVFSSLNTSNSLQHITAMSDWFYCYYFGFLFDNLIVLTLIMQEKENPICAYQNLDQQIELIKNELIRYLLFADCGDAVEINKNVVVDLGIVGDAKNVLKELNEKLTRQNHPQWLKEIRDLKERYPLSYDDEGLTGPYVIEQIDYLTNSEAIICTDVGQHQMWAAQYFNYRRPRQFISSGGAGTMGFGLGAAMGAKLANPHQTVFNIAGDGCFRMNLNELATLSRYNIPVIQVVMNNQVLGMVRQWQTLFYGQRYSNTILEDKVDFCKVAEGLGCKAIKVTTKEEVASAIKIAMEHDGPVVIECMIGKDDKVFPMVAPGGAIAEAFDDTDLKNKQ